MEDLGIHADCPQPVAHRQATTATETTTSVSGSSVPPSGAFARYVVVDVEGREAEVNRDSFASCPVLQGEGGRIAMFRQFVANALGIPRSAAEQSPHIDLMRRHELVDTCEASEKGHLKWFPKGALIHRLILEYASNLAREWGAMEMRNPVLIRGDHNVVGELMGEFHERDYRVDGGRGTCYLRYASDPLGFPFMQGVQFSHRQTPLKVYEEASCFRNEQEGEVSGLRRVRNFLMTDMHAACASEEEAAREFEHLCHRFARLMDEVIAPERWVLGWEGTIDFYEENRDWLIGIGRDLGVPSLFKLVPEMSHYYAMKNEYQFITPDGANVQVSTVQWDVKDGPRFNIGFTDPNGRKQPCPVIIHASSFGSIERTLCAILENAAEVADSGNPACFPLWLSPTQVRIIPVGPDVLEYSDDLCRQFSQRNIRADVDDRDESVGKRIRDAEREWVPYQLVVGKREMASGRLSVRIRTEEAQREMRVDELTEVILGQTEGMPSRPLPLPTRLSMRPIFYG